MENHLKDKPTKRYCNLLEAHGARRPEPIILYHPEGVTFVNIIVKGATAGYYDNPDDNLAPIYTAPGQPSRFASVVARGQGLMENQIKDQIQSY